jgi:hypothetical protein
VEKELGRPAFEHAELAAVVPGQGVGTNDKGRLAADSCSPNTIRRHWLSNDPFENTTPLCFFWKESKIPPGVICVGAKAQPNNPLLLAQVFK